MDLTSGEIAIGCLSGILSVAASKAIELFKAKRQETRSDADQAVSIYKGLVEEFKKDAAELLTCQKKLEEENLKLREQVALLKTLSKQ